MDKLVYVAMSGAKETLAAQAANNYNLANASTTGFKADLSAFQSRPVSGPGYASRVYATDSTVGYDATTGEQVTTGNPLDITVQGSGFFAVQDTSGNEAYTRAGDLHVEPSGQLMTATGHAVMGDNGPIAVPPASSVSIAADGTVSVVPLGQSPMTNSVVGRIKLVSPPSGSLERGSDGLYRSPGGTPLEADAGATVSSGVLEASNVNIASALVNMIELARRFELQVKSVHTAEDDAASSAKLLQSG